MIRILTLIKSDTHRNSLHYFYVIAGSVFRRQEAKARSGCATYGLNCSVVFLTISINLDFDWLSNFHVTQLRFFKVGQPVKIKVDAYGKEYNGTVESIGGATGARFSLLPPENATGNYVKVVQRIPVRIRFDKGQDPNHQLRPGMSVEPTVYTK